MPISPGIKLNSNGQATSANSSPVVLASDQSAIAVSAASLPLPLLASTSTKQSDGSQKTQIVDGSGNVVSTTTNALDVNIKSGAFTVGENLAQVNGATVNVGTGTASTGTQRVAVSSDSSIILATGVAEIGNVKNSGTFAVQATPVTQLDTFMLGGVNVKEINAVTPLMGSGIMGTGSMRVTIASDNDALTVKQATGTNLHTVLDSGTLTTLTTLTGITNALPIGSNVIGKVSIDQATPGTTNLVALSTETTKTIGVTRTADGAGNLLTSNSTTFAGKFGLDGNLLGTLGTAFSTAGKVDIKAADGDVFVRSNAGSTFPVNATLQTQTDTVMVGGVNIKEINAVAPLMGSGIMGTGSLRVTIASDNDAVTVKQATGTNLHVVTDTGSTTAVTGTVATQAVRSATPALSTVTVLITNTAILASNANRLGGIIYNESGAIIYLAFGATSSTTAYTTQVAIGGYYEIPFNFTGAISAVTLAVNAVVRVTELTA